MGYRQRKVKTLLDAALKEEFHLNDFTAFLPPFGKIGQHSMNTLNRPNQADGSFPDIDVCG
jgi:hypothetical protein